MQQSLMTHKLIGLEAQMLQKINQVETLKEKAIYEMYSALIKMSQSQISQIEEMRNEADFQKIVIKHQGTFYELMGEIIMRLEELVEVPYVALIGKKLYEEMDELIADLEDWIETINEDLEGKEKQFAYMEAWDIGVFFEN